MSDGEDFFSHLDDALTGADSAAALQAKATAGQIMPLAMGFSDKCKACRGTGAFHSYTGRLVGPCFKCKGKGVVFYKTSSEDRAQARARKEANAERKAESNVAAYFAAHPDIAAWIERNPSFEFARNMREAIAKIGRLTVNQESAALKCIDRDAERAKAKEEREANAPVIDLSRIEDAMRAAQSHSIKYPRLNVGAFVFSLAGAQSKNPGAVYVKAASGDYMGKVQGGKFFAARECGTEASAAILAAASDPRAAAIAYGKQYGVCACCGRELSNPESVALGIGPICATKHGW